MSSNRRRWRVTALVTASVLVFGACSTNAAESPGVASRQGTSTTTTVAYVGEGSDLTAAAVSFVAGLALPDDPVPLDFVVAARLEASCVAHFGFSLADPESAERTGVNIFDVPPPQRQRADEVVTACRAGLIDNGVVLSSDAAAWGVRFDAWLEVQECLISNGYPVVEPPTRETFLENPGVWQPYDGLIEDRAGTGVIIVPFGPITQSETYRLYFEALDVCPKP